MVSLLVLMYMNSNFDSFGYLGTSFTKFMLCYCICKSTVGEMMFWNLRRDGLKLILYFYGSFHFCFLWFPYCFPTHRWGTSKVVGSLLTFSSVILESRLTLFRLHSGIFLSFSLTCCHFPWLLFSLDDIMVVSRVLIKKIVATTFYCMKKMPSWDSTYVLVARFILQISQIRRLKLHCPVFPKRRFWQFFHRIE